MNIKPFDRYLPVVLTVAEQVEFGRKLAQAHQEYAAVEAEKKAAAEQFKLRLEEIDGQCVRLARIVRSGEEFRDVTCKWHYLFETNIKELVRMDTGEIVETQAITPDERQLMLQIEHEREASESASETVAKD